MKETPKVSVTQAAVIASEKLAEALVVGVDYAALNGHPMTQLQRRDLLASALLAFDGYEQALREICGVEERIEALRPRGQG